MKHPPAVRKDDMAMVAPTTLPVQWVLPMRSIHLSFLLTSAPLRHPYLPQ